MTLCKRIIAVILIENGLVVRRVGFKTQSIIGRPEITIKYLQNWDVDEIFFINVGEKKDITQVLEFATQKVFLPISVGGSINSIEEVDHLMKHGADKIVIGKHASKELLTEITDKYGNQAVCLSIDENHSEIPDWPCGEILMHDKTRDGIGNGLNLDILKKPVYKNGEPIDKPIIAMGGVGQYGHIVEGLKECSAVAVGNMFHFKEISAKQAKKTAFDIGYNIRL